LLLVEKNEEQRYQYLVIGREERRTKVSVSCYW
jgi:hypothetical protein